MITALKLDRIGVGIDTARYGHRVSFLRPDLERAAPSLTVMEKREGYQALEDRLRNLREQHPQADIYVRIDAAGQYAVNLELFLRKLGLGMIVSVGEPKRNKDYRKAHFPKRTNDDTESLAMARFAVVELPKATPPPSIPLVLLREACGRLQTQVKQTTQVVNRLHNLLARAFPEFATLTEDIATGWALTLLEKYPTAERIARVHLASLVKIPYLSRDNAQAIHHAAQESVATLRGTVAEALIRPRSPRCEPVSLPRWISRNCCRVPLMNCRTAATAGSSRSPASARPRPRSSSPRSSTSTGSRPPSAWSTTSVSSPRRTAPASTSGAAHYPPAHCPCPGRAMISSAATSGMPPGSRSNAIPPLRLNITA